MVDQRSEAYFARRESEERAAAQTATAKEARAIHLQMAYRYAALRQQAVASAGLEAPGRSRGHA